MFDFDLATLGEYLKNVTTAGSKQNIAMFGGKIGDNQVNGMANTLAGGVSSIADLWSGMQQLNLARDQLAFQKDAFNKNWAAQRTTTNTALADRQRARLGANPTGYESLDSYMGKNGI
jgi:hypothetical protein